MIKVLVLGEQGRKAMLKILKTMEALLLLVIFSDVT